MTTGRETDEGAKRAGRGGLFVLGAKVFFILAGLVQQALLPKALGLAGYGALSRVLAASNILNNVVVSSSTSIARGTAVLSRNCRIWVSRRRMASPIQRATSTGRPG